MKKLIGLWKIKKLRMVIVTIITVIVTLLCIKFIFVDSAKNKRYLVQTTSSVIGNWEKEEPKEEKQYIKWVENNLTTTVLEKTSKLDIDSHVNDEVVKYNWIELISYLACKYGNDFKKFKQKDLDNLVQELKSGNTMENLNKDSKYYSYYLESYTAILQEFLGEYEIEVETEMRRNNI